MAIVIVCAGTVIGAAFDGRYTWVELGVTVLMYGYVAYVAAMTAGMGLLLRERRYGYQSLR